MKKLRAVAAGVVAALLLVVIGGPFVYVLVLSFFAEGPAFSAEGYYRVFLGSQEYLLNFWRSLFLCAVIVAGQVVLSVFAGLGFAKYAFPGKNFWFFLLLAEASEPLGSGGWGVSWVWQPARALQASKQTVSSKASFFIGQPPILSHLYAKHFYRGSISFSQGDVNVIYSITTKSPGKDNATVRCRANTSHIILRKRCDDSGAIDGMNASERSIRGDSRAFFTRAEGRMR